LTPVYLIYFQLERENELLVSGAGGSRNIREMVGIGCIAGVGVYHPSWHHHRIRILTSKSEETVKVTRWWSLFSASAYETRHRCRPRPRRPCCVPKDIDAEEEGPSTSERLELEWKLLSRRIGDSGIISSCLVGLLTGVAVVVFNYAVS